MKGKDIEIIYLDVDKLIEPDYNPRKISAKQKEEIKKSLDTFGFVQPLVVNTHDGRENIVVGGNQRLKIAKSLGYEKAPCVLVDIPEAEEKELNLRLNKNQAEFDFDMLSEFFDSSLLFDVGFTEKEIGKILTPFEEEFEKCTDDNAEMPIFQKFNERYRTIMIFCDNEMDFNWLRNVLELERKKCYKSSKVGEALVITVQDFQKIWEKNTESDEQI